MSWEGVAKDHPCGGFERYHVPGCDCEKEPEKHGGSITAARLLSEVPTMDQIKKERNFWTDELWAYIDDPPCLYLRAPGQEPGPDTDDVYWIPLRDLDSKEILKWIAQIHDKAWCSNRVMGSLIRCLYEIVNLHQVAHEKKSGDAFKKAFPNANKEWKKRDRRVFNAIQRRRRFP